MAYDLIIRVKRPAKRQQPDPYTKLFSIKEYRYKRLENP